MSKFIITVTVPSDKVSLIKLLRDFTDIGLKAAKDFVEENWSHYYQGYSIEEVSIELIVSYEELGRAYSARLFSEKSDTFRARRWNIDSIANLPLRADLSFLKDMS